MFNAINISTSGLIAQRVRMNTTALNLANAEAFNADGTPYQRRAVLFQTGKTPGDRTGQGVHIAAIDKQNVYRYIYDPAHPYANADGTVKMPGIDHITETLNGMEAARAYEANLAAIELSKAMLHSSLRLLA